MEHLVQTPVTHAPLSLKNAYSTWPICKDEANSYNFVLVGTCCSNSFFLLSVKATCKGCEPWQQPAICLSVKPVRGPQLAKHLEWKFPEQDDGFWACGFLFCSGARIHE